MSLLSTTTQQACLRRHLHNLPTDAQIDLRKHSVLITGILDLHLNDGAVLQRFESQNSATSTIGAPLSSSAEWIRSWSTSFKAYMTTALDALDSGAAKFPWMNLMYFKGSRGAFLDSLSMYLNELLRSGIETSSHAFLLLMESFQTMVTPFLEWLVSMFAPLGKAVQDVARSWIGEVHALAVALKDTTLHVLGDALGGIGRHLRSVIHNVAAVAQRVLQSVYTRKHLVSLDWNVRVLQSAMESATTLIIGNGGLSPIGVHSEECRLLHEAALALQADNYVSSLLAMLPGGDHVSVHIHGTIRSYLFACKALFEKINSTLFDHYYGEGALVRPPVAGRDVFPQRTSWALGSALHYLRQLWRGDADQRERAIADAKRLQANDYLRAAEAASYLLQLIDDVDSCKVAALTRITTLAGSTIELLSRVLRQRFEPDDTDYDVATSMQDVKTTFAKLHTEATAPTTSAPTLADQLLHTEAGRNVETTAVLRVGAQEREAVEKRLKEVQDGEVALDSADLRELRNVLAGLRRSGRVVRARMMDVHTLGNDEHTSALVAPLQTEANHYAGFLQRLVLLVRKYNPGVEGLAFIEDATQREIQHALTRRNYDVLDDDESPLSYLGEDDVAQARASIALVGTKIVDPETGISVRADEGADDRSATRAVDTATRYTVVSENVTRNVETLVRNSAEGVLSLMRDSVVSLPTDAQLVEALDSLVNEKTAQLSAQLSELEREMRANEQAQLRKYHALFLMRKAHQTEFQFILRETKSLEMTVASEQGHIKVFREILGGLENIIHPRKDVIVRVKNIIDVHVTRLRDAQQMADTAGTLLKNYLTTLSAHELLRDVRADIHKTMWGSLVLMGGLVAAWSLATLYAPLLDVDYSRLNANADAHLATAQNNARKIEEESLNDLNDMIARKEREKKSLLDIIRLPESEEMRDWRAIEQQHIDYVARRLDPTKVLAEVKRNEGTLQTPWRVLKSWFGAEPDLVKQRAELLVRSREGGVDALSSLLKDSEDTGGARSGFMEHLSRQRAFLKEKADYFREQNEGGLQAAVLTFERSQLHWRELYRDMLGDIDGTLVRLATEKAHESAKIASHVANLVELRSRLDNPVSAVSSVLFPASTPKTRIEYLLTLLTDDAKSEQYSSAIEALGIDLRVDDMTNAIAAGRIYNPMQLGGRYGMIVRKFYYVLDSTVGQMVGAGIQSVQEIKTMSFYLSLAEMVPSLGSIAPGLMAAYTAYTSKGFAGIMRVAQVSSGFTTNMITHELAFFYGAAMVAAGTLIALPLAYIVFGVAWQYTKGRYFHRARVASIYTEASGSTFVPSVPVVRILLANTFDILRVGAAVLSARSFYNMVMGTMRGVLSSFVVSGAITAISFARSMVIGGGSVSSGLSSVAGPLTISSMRSGVAVPSSFMHKLSDMSMKKGSLVLDNVRALGKESSEFVNTGEINAVLGTLEKRATALQRLVNRYKVDRLAVEKIIKVVWNDEALIQDLQDSDRAVDFMARAESLISRSEKTLVKLDSSRSPTDLAKIYDFARTLTVARLTQPALLPYARPPGPSRHHHQQKTKPPLLAIAPGPTIDVFSDDEDE